MSQQLFAAASSQTTLQASDSHKAALLLHALGESDRAWLLGELPLPQRQQLQTLLDELQMLHIPVDRDFVQNVMAAAAPPVAKGSRRADAAEHALASADPGALTRLLSAEPVELIAGLIGQRAWPWTAQLLSGLKEGKRQMVLARLAQQDALADRPPSSRQIDRHLLELLEARLAAPIVEPPPGRNPVGLSMHVRRAAPAWWRDLLRHLLRRDRIVEVIR